MEKISVSDLSIGDWVNQKMNDGHIRCNGLNEKW